MSNLVQVYSEKSRFNYLINQDTPIRVEIGKYKNNSRIYTDEEYAYVNFNFSVCNVSIRFEGIEVGDDLDFNFKLEHSILSELYKDIKTIDYINLDEILERAIKKYKGDK